MTTTHREVPTGTRTELLLSRTTFLVLSSFLVAFAAQWVGETHMRFYLLYASAVGILAFIGLEYRADLIKHIASNQASLKAAAKLMRYTGWQRDLAPQPIVPAQRD